MAAGLLPLVFLGALLEVCSGVSANRGGYPSFTDEIPFKITWPGAEFTMVRSECTARGGGVSQFPSFLSFFLSAAA